MASREVSMNKLESQKKYKTSKKGIETERRWIRKRGPQYQELRHRVLEKLGGQCVECGFSDYRALQIDHINGGGDEDRRTHSKKTFYENVLEDDGKVYQLLCANCNWIKRYENKEYKGYTRK